MRPVDHYRTRMAYFWAGCAKATTFPWSAEAYISPARWERHFVEVDDLHRTITYREALTKKGAERSNPGPVWCSAPFMPVETCDWCERLGPASRVYMRQAHLSVHEKHIAASYEAAMLSGKTWRQRQTGGDPRWPILCTGCNNRFRAFWRRFAAAQEMKRDIAKFKEELRNDH